MSRKSKKSQMSKVSQTSTFTDFYRDNRSKNQFADNFLQIFKLELE